MIQPGLVNIYSIYLVYFFPASHGLKDTRGREEKMLSASQ